MAFIKLSGSVGVDGDNNAADVKLVKTRLRELGYSWVTDSNQVDAPTIKAIKLFQAIKNGQRAVTPADGLIDVGGGTHLWLEALNAPRWMLFPAGSEASGLVHVFQANDPHDSATDWLIDTMRDAGTFYRQNFTTGNRPAISVNDVSLPQGGDTAHHAGHETGLDADFRLPKTGGGSGGITFNAPNYDRTAMRKMLKSIRAQPLVIRIRFNDPVLINEGLCQFTSGHANHGHVDIQPPAPDKPTKVQVRINGAAASSVHAFLAGGSTWVPARSMVRALRAITNDQTDDIDSVSQNPFRVTVRISSNLHQLDAITYFGTGYVKSRDLEPHYGPAFRFVPGVEPRLEIP